MAYNLDHGNPGVAPMQELFSPYWLRHLDTMDDDERRPLPPLCALYEPRGYFGAVRGGMNGIFWGVWER